MDVNLSVLTPDDLGPAAGNASRVAAVASIVEPRSDAVPHLLLPVRLETRFVRREVPVADLPGPGGLIAALDRLTLALRRVARADVETAIVGTVPQKRKAKAAAYGTLEKLFDEALATLADAEELARQPLAGDAAAEKALAASLEAALAELPRAQASIGRLRSEFQRRRFEAVLLELGARLERLAEAIRLEVLPGSRLLREVRLPEGPGERGTIDRGRLTASARAATAMRGRIEDLQRRLDALFAGPPPGPAEVEAALAAPVREAAAQAGAIAVVPAAWRDELAGDAGAVAERLRLLAPRAAGEAGSRLAELAAALDAAGGRIHADDRPGGLGAAPATKVVDELWVRIYPDELHVDTHEEALTVEERDAGFAFWRETLAAGSDEVLMRGAWRALVAKFGSRRAAWIADVTAPEPPAMPDAEAGARIIAALRTLHKRLDEVARSTPERGVRALLRAADALEAAVEGDPLVPAAALERIAALLASAEAKLRGLEIAIRDAVPADELEAARFRVMRRLARAERFVTTARERLAEAPASPEPDFPDVPLRDATWTRAARSPALPDRFVVVTVSGGRPSHVVAGSAVPADLRLGLDPRPDDPESERFGLDLEGNLIVGASIRWMVDFEEALRVGMAVRIPITAEQAGAGFDRVYVVGVQRGTAAEGAARLGELLDNHHYGHQGLALVPVGTPTNNSEAEGAGFRADDDPEASFDLERTGSLVADERGDGARLAAALGVDPERLAHVAGADGRDVEEALAMSAALWPATMGFALEEMLDPLFSLDSRDRLKAFALANVTARGLLPSFRVGPQPYGVLATTAHSRFIPAEDERPRPFGPFGRRGPQARFDRLLGDVLRQMGRDWERLAVDVAHAHSDGVEDVQQHFLDMLGLDATSVEQDYRFALNVARRGLPAGGVPPLDAQRGEGEVVPSGPLALLERFEPIVRAAFGLGSGPLLDGGVVSETFADVNRLLQDARAYQVRLIQTPRPLTGTAAENAATWIPALLAATPASLIAEARAGGRGKPLLYLLLRQALLLELREAALDILDVEGMLTEDARRRAGSSNEFYVRTIRADSSVTRWSYLSGSLMDLDGRFGIDFAPAALYGYLLGRGGAPTMERYLAARGANPIFAGFAGPLRNRHEEIVARLQAHAALVAGLAVIPSERLAALTAEHLDVCSYRLDAWRTGLAQRRLGEMRAAAPRGVHLGAFGWVENLCPDAGHPLAEDVPPLLADDPRTPIHRDPETQGFIHAPSMNHAVTAAILRSGFLSEAREPDEENRMAVNLSSRRVRMALEVIDGVRAGNDLGALLGYQLERFLHDSHARGTGTLDDLIAPLRRAFPSAAGVDPAASTPETAARQVVDGLALLETVTRGLEDAGGGPPGATLGEALRVSGYEGRPFELVEEPDRPVMIEAIDRLADVLDAVGDLVVAEGVHQIAQGNHPRAAAALSALTEGRAPPRPEIVDTPRTGTLLSQRLLLQLTPVDAAGGAAALPADWAHLPMTPRAAAEPSLNRWLGGLIGRPEEIVARVVRPDPDRPGAMEAVAWVTVEDLGLQPIDLLTMLGAGLEEGFAAISARIIDTQRPADVTGEAAPAELSVELARDDRWPPEARSLLEVAPFLEAAAELVSRGRPARASDYMLLETAPAADPAADAGLDELEARVAAAVAGLRALGLRLLGLVSGGADADPALLLGDPALYLTSQEAVHRTVVDGRRELRDVDGLWAQRDAFRQALLDAGAFGVPQVSPPVRYLSRAAVAAELLEDAELAFGEVARRVQAADGLDAERAAAPDPVAALVAVAEAVFGESFRILPRYALRNAAEIAGAQADLAGASTVDLDAWLHGVAAVRRGAGALATLSVLGDAFDRPVPELRALQLPAVAGEPWLGGELPPELAPSGDKVSLVVAGADALDLDGGLSVGLLVDQWTEVIPSPRRDDRRRGPLRPARRDAAAVPAAGRAAGAGVGGWRLERPGADAARHARARQERGPSSWSTCTATSTASSCRRCSASSCPRQPARGGAEIPGNRVILDFGADNPGRDDGCDRLRSPASRCASGAGSSRGARQVEFDRALAGAGARSAVDARPAVAVRRVQGRGHRVGGARHAGPQRDPVGRGRAPARASTPYDDRRAARDAGRAAADRVPAARRRAMRGNGC